MPPMTHSFPMHSESSPPDPTPTPWRQGEINFGDSTGGDGVERWHQQRQDAQRALAMELGLPLGRNVEVWLKDGVELHGVLRLKETLLFLDTVKEADLEFVVERTNFKYADIQSCVRSD